MRGAPRQAGPQGPGYARRKYVWTSAYASSKKALWYYAKEMATRTRRGRVAILTVDPGRTATGLTRRLGPIEDLLLYLQNVFVKTVPQGAASVVHACLAERLRGKSGAYIKNCRVHGKGAGTARQRERLRAETDAAIAGAALDSWREVDVYGQAVGRVLSRGLSPLLELVGLKQGKGKRV
ncbi:unnamed protein product [Ostreobium quekettii]|uniref:Uncharacterized protein n=1 Tax=Ostreobium quekettii TaxID=121088 RepID=A0A8S1J7B8_9CHLO|nr:unnamed protein product [Ostreobium quekettii]|eukprot:evm.model.scf_281.6 EVM.evm.TU.scf_281.6   scf_281:63503-64042(+)